jgi:hypothetical protein
MNLFFLGVRHSEHNVLVSAAPVWTFTCVDFSLGFSLLGGSMPKERIGQIQRIFFFWRGGGVRDRVSLCGPGCPGTHSVDQAGHELRNPPASASQVLGLKACATMPG